MKKYLALLASVLLTSCSTYSTDFDCPKGDGLKCTALHTVNEKITKGEIGIVQVIRPQNPESKRTVRSYSEKEMIIYLPETHEKILIEGIQK